MIQEESKMKKTNLAALILMIALVCAIDCRVRLHQISLIRDEIDSMSMGTEGETATVGGGKNYVNQGVLPEFTTDNNTENNANQESANMEDGTIGNDGTVWKAPAYWVQLVHPDEVDYVGASRPTGAATEPDRAIPLECPTMEELYGGESVDALERDTCYTLVVDDLPFGFLSGDDVQYVAVVYPAKIAAGETGKFQVWIEIDNQYYYAFLTVKSQDDVT